jgi:hypothetical protein
MNRAGIPGDKSVLASRCRWCASSNSMGETSPWDQKGKRLEPVYPLDRRVFDVVDAAPGSSTVNDFRDLSSTTKITQFSRTSSGIHGDPTFGGRTMTPPDCRTGCKSAGIDTELRYSDARGEKRTSQFRMSGQVCGTFA